MLLFINVLTNYNMSKQKEELITIRIEKLLKERYQKFCDESGLSISKRLRLFIEKDLKGKLEIKK